MNNQEQAFATEVPCTKVDEFLDKLSPRGGVSRRYESTPVSERDQLGIVVFRGIGDAAFKLIPTALRHDSAIPRLVHFVPSTEADQIIAEARLLHRFFSLADSAGLPLPEDSQALRKHIAAVCQSGYTDSLAVHGSTWPPDELLSLLAIGQHYGLPTRLLDWTRSYLTAAYFAASDAKRRQEQGPIDQGAKRGEERLAVWVFDYYLYLSRTGQLDNRGRPKAHKPTPPTIELITAPHAGNPNLHAQDGVFSLFRPKRVAPESAIDRRSLDTLANSTLPDDMSTIANDKEGIFSKVTLPHSEAQLLMSALASEGVSASRLFPGYGGAVKSLMEE